MRLSNFLIWELAYSEIYITDKFWPEFRRTDLYESIMNYQKRERRYGKTSDQIANENNKESESYISRVVNVFKIK
jgi:undecaprenyl diphosphate synthase